VRLLVLGNAVGGDIPHLRVWVLDVLLHAEPGGLGLVLAVAQAAELAEVSLDAVVYMPASVSRRGAILASTLQLGLGLVVVAHVCLALLDQLLGGVMHALKRVGRVGDLGWGESKPRMVSSMATKYSSLSVSGFVSSNLRI
jgi:hypothetical protein